MQAAVGADMPAVVEAGVWASVQAGVGACVQAGVGACVWGGSALAPGISWVFRLASSGPTSPVTILRFLDPVAAD